MEVPKEGSPAGLAVLHAVKVGVQGVRELAHAPRWIERIRRAVKDRPVFGDEVIPGRVAPERAPRRQREVRHVQGGEVAIALA